MRIGGKKNPDLAGRLRKPKKNMSLRTHETGKREIGGSVVSGGQKDGSRTRGEGGDWYGH